MRWAIAVCTAGLILAVTTTLVIFSVKSEEAEYAVVCDVESLGLEPEDSAMVMAMARQESGFDPKTVGSYGEVGLLQLTWVVAEEQKLDSTFVFDPQANLRAGSNHYLALKRRLLNKFPDLSDPEIFAAGAYNMGMTRLQNLFRQGAPRDLKKFLLWLETAEDVRGIDPKKKAVVLVYMRRVSTYYGYYIAALPNMMQREKPQVVEYIETAKTIIVETTSCKKWFLHLMFGGLIFLAIKGLLMPFARPRNHIDALLIVSLIAVAVEVIDLWEAIINSKGFNPSNSAEDIFFTVLIPVVLVLVHRIGSCRHLRK